jgi:cellobiose phosphorylase
MKEYTVTRQLRDTTFEITVRNPEGRQSGVKRITCDGQPVSGNIVKAAPGRHIVEVEM